MEYSLAESMGGLPEQGMRGRGGGGGVGEMVVRAYISARGWAMASFHLCQCYDHSSTCQMTEHRAVWELEESLIYSGCG